jgi:hypothetical protein
VQRGKPEPETDHIMTHQNQFDDQSHPNPELTSIEPDIELSSINAPADAHVGTPLFGQLTHTPTATPLNGKDEMNLAEFPIARLGRSDTRLTIEYKGQIIDKLGNVIEQKWLVSGNATFGLPTEFADRVLVALMYITSKESSKEISKETNLKVNNLDRRVPFTIYRVIKLLGLSRNKRNYSAVEKALQQLVGVTIYSEGAFWDHQQQKRITTKKGFHILEEFWLKSFDEDDSREDGEDDAGEDVESASVESGSIHSQSDIPHHPDTITGYIVWGERIWDSFQAGYIKNLDIDFYYSLENTLARRLFRFLDKRMHYQESYQIDIFDLAARLGMKPYPFASHIARKLKPAFDELQAYGYLTRVDIIKVGDFTRVRFTRAGSTAPFTQTLQGRTEGLQSQVHALQIQSTTRGDDEPQNPAFSPLTQCQQIWGTVLTEYQRSLPPATYAMLTNSALLSLDDNHATVAVDPRYQEWIARQMARQIKTLLNQHLDPDERVQEIHVTTLPT